MLCSQGTHEAVLTLLTADSSGTVGSCLLMEPRWAAFIHPGIHHLHGAVLKMQTNNVDTDPALQDFSS